jgi:hypothetical protein
MVAAEAGHTQAVEHLINRGEDLDFDVEGKTAASLAFYNEHDGIVLSLIKNNAKYPRNYNHEDASENLKAFVNLSNEMHEKVREVDEESLEGTKNLIKENAGRFPTLRYFYDSKNNSLLKTSIICKMFEIYKLLLSLNFILGEHESVNDTMNQLTDEERCDLREINEELSTNIFTEPMMILMRNCKLGPGVIDDGSFIEFIRKAFDFLFKIPQVAWILKVVAARRQFKIIFDFTRDSVQFLDPSSEPYTNGLFYPAGRIYIAAKDMLDPEKFLEVYSVMAHELCHFAMFLVYENDAKPYREREKLIEAEYKRITEECKELSQCQEIVRNVFFENYPEEMFHAELIVRVPQMIVAFSNDQVFTLLLMRRKFQRLFNFYESSVVPEMERELPKLEKKYSKNKKEEKLKLWIKVLIAFVCLLVPIGLAAILYVHSPTYSWSKLNNNEKFQFNNAKLNYYGVDVKFGELFANNSEVYDQLPSEHISYGLNENYLKLSKALSSTYSHKIFLNFSNMTESLKENFVGREVNFQGQKVKIKDILKNFEALNFLTCSEVRQTFEGHPINISSQTEVKTKFFIQRNFIDEEKEFESSEQYKNGDINKKNSDVKNFTKIFSEVEKSKIFILSSLAGEGKSSSFENFALELKEKNPENWIQFVDLKKHSEAYKKGKKIDLEDPEELLNFLMKNLMNLNKLESEIFRELFNLSRVTFLWDGIDEISPLYKDFMLDLTSIIKKTSNNFQFISTRPQFSKDFREKFNVKAHKLIPLGKSSRFEFLTKSIAPSFNKSIEEFWKKVLKISGGNFDNFLLMKYSSNFYQENSKLFSLIEKAETILDSLAKSEQTENSITNPLLLRMLSEILSDEEFDENSNLDFYSIYDIFIDKKLELTRQKGENVGKNIDKVLKSSKVNLMQVYQAFALKHIFEDFLEDPLQAKKFKISELQIMKEISKLNGSLISRFGILDANSELDFTFVHQTFAEFLVVKFLIDNFEDFNATEPKKDSDLKIYLLNSVLFTEKFEIVKKFLLDFAKEKDEDLKFFEVLKNLRKFSLVFNKHFLNFSAFESFQTFFNFSKSVKVLNFYNEMKNQLEENFLKNFDIKKDLMSSGRLSQSLLHEIIKNDESAEFFTKFFKVISKVLNREEILQLILKEDRLFKRISFMYAAQQSKLKVLKVFWNFLNETFDENEIKNILMKEDKYTKITLQYSMYNKDPESFLFIKKIYEQKISPDEIRKILKKKIKVFINAIIYASSETLFEISKYLENLFKDDKIELRKILSQKDFDEKTIFSKFYSDEVYAEKLKIFTELLRKTFDENQEKEFKNDFTSLKFNLKFFQNFTADFQSFSFNSESKCSRDDFLFLVENFEEIKKKLCKTSLRKILQMKATIWGSLDNSFLHLFAFSNENEKFLEIIEEYLNKTEIFNLILAKNKNDENSLMLAAKNKNFRTLKVFWKFFEDNLAEKKIIEEILKHANKNYSISSWTALQYAAQNKDPKSFLFVKEIYEKFLTQEEIRKIFSLENKRNLFIKQVFESSPETANEVFKYLDYLFKNEKIELRKVLSRRDDGGDTIYRLVKNQKELKIITELLEKTFDGKNKKDFINYLNALHLKLFIFADYFENFQNFTVTKSEFGWSEDDFKFLINNFEQLKYDLGDEKLKEILLMKDKNKRTILHDLLNKNFDLESFVEPVLEKIANILSKPETLRMIYAKDVLNKTSIYLVTQFANLKVSKAFWKFLDKNLNEIEMKEILLAKSDGLNNPLEASITNPDLYFFMLEIYEKNWNKKELQEILGESLYDVSPHTSPETVSSQSIWNIYLKIKKKN